MSRAAGELVSSLLGLWLLLCSWVCPGSTEPRAPPDRIGRRPWGGAEGGAGVRPAPGGSCLVHQAPHWVARAEPCALGILPGSRLSVAFGAPRERAWKCAHLRNGPWEGDPSGRAGTFQASLQPLSRKPGGRGRPCALSPPSPAAPLGGQSSGLS